MSERLYNLLPQIVRLRDAERSGQLRALLAVIEAELDRVGDDIEQLYDSWFIETCPEWVVPYIGDLVKAPALTEKATVTVSRRAFVANTLAYRRRKGTAPVLEQVARDVSGWPSRATEYFQRVSTCQHLQHLRLTSHGTVDIRNADACQRVDGPFESATHLVDMHNIETGRGRYNIQNVGLTLWRLQRFELAQAEATLGTAAGCYHLSPLSTGLVLLCKPETETEITHLAEEYNVPSVLRARALHLELASAAAEERHYFSSDPSVAFYYGRPETGATLNAVAVENIQIGTIDDTLPDWPRPSPTSEDGTPNLLFDPRRGRVSMPDLPEGDRLFVTYGYASPAKLGGGPYDRDDDLAGILPSPITLRYAVSRSELPGGSVYTTLEEAVAAWTDEADAESVGLITILDNGVYELAEPLVVDVPSGARLVIAAASWPDRDDDADYSARGVRPWLRGDLEIRGNGGDSAFALHGVVLEGALDVEAGSSVVGGLESCTISHCTLLGYADSPSLPAVSSGAGNPALTVTLTRSILGSVQLDETSAGVEATDCIFDTDPGGDSLVGTGADVTIEGCTLVGMVQVRTLEASNSIFLGEVYAARRQEGCVRYSYVGLDEHTPKRYRCQPDLAVVGITDAADLQAAADAVRPQLRGRTYVRPATGTAPAMVDPDYLRLSNRCPTGISRGADDGAEMGAFHHLGEAHRVKNLETAVEDHLRAGCATANRFLT